MFIRIDDRAPEPLYDQIAAGIRRSVLDGSAPLGSRLPSARDLAETLDVNMHTVLRAYGILRDEGVLEVRRGRGVTVIASPARVDVQRRLRDLVASARAEGLGPDEIRALLDDHLTEQKGGA